MPLTTSGRPQAVRIAVTSGKGGVGKTSLSINLAVALRRLGHKVGVLDADFALGNVDVHLGLSPAAHLGAVLDGSRAISDIIVDGPHGIRVIPAGSGVRALSALDDAMWVRFVEAVHDAGRDLDFLLLDTATGISNNVLDVVGLSDHVLVVTSYEPAAVVDAYAMIKLITTNGLAGSIGVIVNAARDAVEGDVVFRQLAMAADRFLGRAIRYEGYVPEDPTVRDAIYAQRPFVGLDLASEADRCLRRIASRIANTRTGVSPWPVPQPVVTATELAKMEAPRCG